MSCRLCKFILSWLDLESSGGESPWDLTYEWEEDYGGQWDTWQEYTDETEKLIEFAQRIWRSDPSKALATFTELAGEGNIWAMTMCGWHFAKGVGTEVDEELALDYYRDAIAAGSWKATIYYGRLLYARGEHDRWPKVFQNGIEAEFIPAFFWQAWHQYSLSPSHKTARKVKHLLEKASEVGHPNAQVVLARWTSLGKFGLREIPHGLKLVGSAADALLEEDGKGFVGGKQAAQQQTLSYDL